LDETREMFFVALSQGGLSSPQLFPFSPMPREIVIIECTEARKEGKPVSRYMTSRNKKTQTERVEKKKYNPHLRRHTVHKEIK
jgi:large subunit ribosomal protein L33